MPPITALLHTENDALRLGRALETLLPCNEIMIVDHFSIDATRRIAREYGARIVDADDATPNGYSDRARHNWVFCITPTESLSESLQTSLFEWNALSLERVAGGAFNVFIREQIGDSWMELPAPKTRLIPRTWTRWQGNLPAYEPSALPLEGALLRFSLP